MSMSTRKRSRRSSYSSNNNSNNNNNNNNNNIVTRVGTTPLRSNKRMIEVRMSIDDYNRYKDYKKYMKENNIDIPSGQSEYSQRLANLDIEHKKLIQLYNILEKRYKDLIKKCLEEKKVNRYGKKISKSKKNRKSRTIKTGNFNEEAALRKLGMNDIQIGLKFPN